MIENFEYFAPKTVQEALAQLFQFKDECKIIAGGQSLLVLMKQGLVTPKYLIDIKGISALDHIQLDQKECLNIGTLTTHRNIEQSPVICEKFDVLAEMEKNLATLETRNWGSIGGNLCHADPAGDVCPVLIALRGTLSIASQNGERKIDIENFSTDFMETVLEPDEMLIEIQLPKLKPKTGVAYEKFNIVKNDYATVSAAVSITLNLNNCVCTDVLIVLGGVSPTPIRAKHAEVALMENEVNEYLLEEAAQIASEEAKPIADMLASEEYKRQLAKVLVKRVAQKALEKANKI